MNYDLNSVRIKKVLGKFLLAAARNIAVDILIIVLINFLISLFLYNKYKAITKRVEMEIEKPFLLDQNNYKTVVNFWQKNDDRFKSVDSKTYKNLFKAENQD